ncbi:MAG TPA: hypothetical protein VIW29_14895 [Polyangiaceae bacterium]
MRREASIPLFLWIATAALVHLLWGGGAEQAANVIEERLDVSRFAAGIRSHVRGSIAPPLEIALEDESAPEDVIPETEPQEPPQDESTSEDDEPEPEHIQDQPEKTPKVEPKPEKSEPEPEKPPEPKPEEEKPAAPAEEAKPVAQLQLPNKIAVQQHVKDPKQKDNPDAAYIADKANHVAEETRARITSTDQNDEKPNPGAAPTGPKEDPGNAEETHVRQDMDQPGNRDLAPGGSQSENAARATAAAAAKPGQAGAAAPGNPGATKAESSPSTGQAQDQNQIAKAATPERLGNPETVASESGTFALRGPEAPTPEQRAQKAKKRLPPRRPRSLMEALGLGAAGRTPNGVALNLTPHLAAEAVGSDEMSRLLRADGERRRSAHRGSWRTPSLERYRSAIENYVPSVKPGNQTALNTAAVPFAAYLNQIHVRIHPIFADQFLASLDAMPASHPMNDPTLVTALEIVLDREEGRLVRRGVTRTSGVTAFDISAISAVDRAAPFGTPPNEIVSPDGNVYLHWEFRRDQMACSTLFAHPYILKGQPRPATPPSSPPLPPFRGPDDQPPAKGERHGWMVPAPAPKRPAPDG